jgi:hypothetical protein
MASEARALASLFAAVAETAVAFELLWLSYLQPLVGGVVGKTAI